MEEHEASVESEAGELRARKQSGTQCSQPSNLVLLVGEGFGEECDEFVGGDDGLRIQRLTTAGEVAATLAESAHRVCGMVVRQGSSRELAIEALMAMRLASRHVAVAAVVRRGDAAFRRSALRKRARCFEYESGDEATWRAVRCVSFLGAQGPGERRGRVERFAKCHGLTSAQREYVDLISRGIPFADMELVFGVTESTKLHHFRETRARVAAKTREDLYWLFWNDEGEA